LRIEARNMDVKGTKPTELPLVTLRADELPAYCPNPSMPVWNHHPRVYLELAGGRTALCPYCGTRYRVAEGAGH
jgi:uncharacterized Zn-finger protein